MSNELSPMDPSAVDQYMIDTHIHLDSEPFDADRDQVIARAQEAGVRKFISIGAGDGGYKSSYTSIALAEKYDCVWATVGVHPQDASFEFDPEPLKKLVEHPKVVGIGETGLDFFRSDATEEQQVCWFEYQIEIANLHNKPLIIHSREAGQRCYEVLKANNAQAAGGVFHCYAEDYEFFKKIIELNFVISVPGIITFKKSEKLREAVKAIPLDCIMLETDGPFLSPEPYRGKRCESAFMLETAKMIAKVKGVGLGEVMRVTTKTAETRFRI